MSEQSSNPARSLIYSLARCSPLDRSLIYLLARTEIHVFVCFRVHAREIVCFLYSVSCSGAYSRAHMLDRSLIYLLAHMLARSLAHILARSYARSFDSRAALMCACSHNQIVVKHVRARPILGRTNLIKHHNHKQQHKQQESKGPSLCSIPYSPETRRPWARRGKSFSSCIKEFSIMEPTAIERERIWANRKLRTKSLAQ